ncbi:ATP-dependent DNA ligase [Candidatus Woesearchaeota archaeon]|nr:ATP-dependent DNA ligase [Candidatus Woesearchaeota archaeon]
MSKKRGLSFSELASLLEELEGISSNISLRDKLAEFFKGKKGKIIKYSSYFILGRVGPKYEDINLGFGNKTMIKIIAGAFDEKEDKVKKIFDKKGDLGDTAEKLNKRKRSSLMLEDVYKKLHKIKDISGRGSQEKRAEEFSELMKKAKGKEAKYIVRIALEKMRLGVGEMTVLEAFAKAFTDDIENKKKIEKSFNVCTDIGELGESLSKHGLKGAKRFSITIGRPVEAMLAQRVKKVSDILEKIKGDKIAAEEKYDGERVQIHKDGNDIKLFSRRLEDITHQFPDLVEYVKDYVKSKKVVLDGEIIAYKKGKILSFQKLMQRRRKYDVKEYRKKIPVVVFLFDILYLNGKSLLKKPYPERRKKLENAVDKKSKKIRLAKRKVSKKFDVIKKFFKKSIDKGLEGIIVKSTAKDSVYQPGNRGWLWIKWKKEYSEGMKEAIDAVVVGSFHGKGKRKGGFGALLCAVFNKDKDRFETFTKVGTGFTDNDFKVIGKKLKKIETGNRPKRLKVKKNMKPDIYYKPKLVIEIIGAEITRSPSHTAAEKNGKGLALRFPRFQRVREDKAPDDATTIKEIKQLKK